MRYIDSWLTGLGLDYIIPKLKENGVTTPKKLAQLELIDMYSILGVEDSEDRKKLYFLIQRLQTILKSKGGGGDNDDEDEPAPPAEIPSPTQKKNLRVVPPPPAAPFNEELMKSTGTERSSEDDLRVLRKNRRTSMDNSMLKRPESAAEMPSDALSKAARRSSHIPQIDRSNSNDQLASAGNSNAAAADFRGPIAVPTAGMRRLSVNPVKKESSGGSGSASSSPHGEVPSAQAARSTKIPSTASAGESKIRAPAKPSVTDAKNAADKQALLLQKQKQLAAEEEALLKLQRANNNANKVTKSIRANAPVSTASTPSPPASPPRGPPPPLQLPSDNANANAAPRSGRPPTQPSSANNSARDRPSPRDPRGDGRRSPPPPYEWEQPAPPPPQAPPRANAVPYQAPAAGRNARPSYPPTSRQQEYSPSTVESEQESEKYTDTDSYDYYDSSYADPDADDGNDEIVDMAIRVVVRKRPISKKELANGDRDVMEVGRRGKVLIHEPKTKVDLTKIIETQEFRFDDAFEANESNEVIYARTIKNLVSFVFDGGKASCFAYGQTGSGKTFTMMGCRPEAPAEARVNAGLYVLAARDIFSMVQEPQHRRLRVFVSCFEIYGGKLFDLLNERNVVKCLEDAKQQVQLPGLSEHQVRDVNELLDLMAQAHTQRSTGTTGANAESSRSHMVMQIVLREPEPTSQANQRMRGRPNISIVAPPASGNQGTLSGKLSFIDLAGSERGADTTHNSKQTRMEGAEINTSLLALKEVIRSLERKHGHTPFRGSKLTQVLKDSFVGEKTRTCMVACVSPSHSNCEHTLNTLRYADRVKEHQSAATGGPSSGAAHVSSSNYDSLAYDAGSSRPQTANSAVANSNAAAANKARPTTANSRPATASPPVIPPAPAARRGDVSSTNSESSNYSNRQASAPSAGIAKPVSRLPTASSGVPTGRSASVSAATANSRRVDNSQVPPSPSRLGQKDALVGRKGIPVRQGSVPRGAVSSSPAAAAPASPAAKKMLRHQSSPTLPNDRRASVGPGARPSSSAAPAGTRRTSSGAARGDDSFTWDDQIQAGENPMGRRSPASASKSFGGRGSVGSAGGNGSFHADSEVEELSFARSDDGEEGPNDPFDSTELIQKTVGLLSAHKLAIAEMVEVMKEEMELVQEMENIDERDSDRYIDRLDRLLGAKGDAIASLRAELNSFQSYRTAMC